MIIANLTCYKKLKGNLLLIKILPVVIFFINRKLNIYEMDKINSHFGNMSQIINIQEL